MPSGRLGHLMARKNQLDNELHNEYSAAMPDSLRLAALKKRKLSLNDEITRLSAHS